MNKLKRCACASLLGGAVAFGLGLPAGPSSGMIQPGVMQASDWLSVRVVHSVTEANPVPALMAAMPAPARSMLPVVVAHGSAGSLSQDGIFVPEGSGSLPRVVIVAREIEGDADGEAAQAQPAMAHESLAGVQPEEDQAGEDIDAHIAGIAESHGVPLPLARAVVQVESSGNPAAVGAAGEIGLMQIKPATARDMGFEGELAELFTPHVNLNYGMRYLGKAYRLAGGDLCGTILRYNAGHSATRMNAVSARYCRKVQEILGIAVPVKVASQ